MKRFAALMLALTVFACCLGFKGRPASAAPVSAPVRTGSVLKAAPQYYTTQAYSSSVYYNNLCEVRLTGNQRLDIINAALSQVGYHEGDSTAQLNGANIYGSHNYTEYCYWYGVNVLGHSEGFYHEWCAIFTAWSARQARIPTTIINNACYAHAGMNPFYFNVVFHPRGTYVPRTGDLIFYDWAYNGKDWDHVGIVTFVQNGRVHTVEGNASDQVLQRDISIYDTEIQGYGAPFYVDSPASASEVSSYPVPAGNLSYGCSGDEVKWLQAALLHLGIPCPIDGYFGSNTLRQLKWFQYLCGMTQDGICGPNVKAAIQYALSRNNINSDDPSQYPIPTRVLSVGCTGNDVKWLQAALKQLGAAITVDGEFGGGTRQKVIWAQQRFGLTQDGVCGPALVNCLRSAIGGGGSSGGGSSGGGGTEPSDYPVPERLLKYGMTGDDVKWLQAVLKKNGYEMNVTGYFGDKTKNAVMGIQSRYGLTADGMVGSVTLAKLKTLVNGPGGGSSGGGEAIPYPEPTRVLRRGMTGDDVMWLQAALKKLGYSIIVDGNFGSGTETVLKNFQSSSGLVPDGVCGPATRGALKSRI
ncbi:MAG: peptidoglycan-binding protein [Clostridia bacterium]|nr:peptidoglycan-binding protein [Clostridia bacterium]